VFENIYKCAHVGLSYKYKIFSTDILHISRAVQNPNHTLAEYNTKHFMPESFLGSDGMHVEYVTEVREEIWPN
jgi:hypothetical protein